MSAVVTQRLSQRYRRVWALRDCSVTVDAGRVVALVGPNGAGKTTLLHAVAGLVTPTAGTVRVFAAPPGTPRALGDIAFVAQDKALYESFRVAELIQLARRLNPRWDNTFALSRLAALEIPMRRRAGRLSGGQQAQVAITLALAKRPRLLLLDEPLANLDPLARAELMREVMASVANSGTTVILSSHAIADLVPVCDWLIVLNQGRVSEVSTPREPEAVARDLSGAADALRRYVVRLVAPDWHLAEDLTVLGVGFGFRRATAYRYRCEDRRGFCLSDVIASTRTAALLVSS